MIPPLSPNSIEEAWNALPDRVKNTPLVKARKPGLLLKLETLQPTGSYKIRAAYTRLSGRADHTKSIALTSSGNFASAFTWACSQFGSPAHLVVTSTVNQRKMEIANQFGCKVHVCGHTYESRFEMLKKLEDEGIEAIDHRTCPTVFLGHATIGWECVSHMQHFDRVLLPVSTGGVALGVAEALRAGGFKGEILGIQPSGNPTVYESWRAGSPIKRDSIDTMCDALTATSIPEQTFARLRELLDDVLLVDEQNVGKAVRFLALEEGIVAEPGASVGVAALLELQRPWKRSLCLITGANIDASTLSLCLQGSAT